MKKLFALILAVAMICAMSVSVFAETTHVVGNRGGENATGTFTDGATSDEFNSAANKEYNVDITATIGNVQNRYAVDIEYELFTFSIAGTNLVWDVNSLQYVVNTTNNGTASDPTKTEYAVSVTNYSDLPVDLTVDITDTMKTDSDNDFAAVTLVGYTDEEKVTLDDAIGCTTSSITSTGAYKAFKVKIAPESGKTWADVTNYYANYFETNGTDTKTMGTLTITISKVPTTTN